MFIRQYNKYYIYNMENLIIREVFVNKGTGQLLVTIPKRSDIIAGEYVVIQRLNINIEEVEDDKTM